MTYEHWVYIYIYIYVPFRHRSLQEWILVQLQMDLCKKLVMFWGITTNNKCITTDIDGSFGPPRLIREDLRRRREAKDLKHSFHPPSWILDSKTSSSSSYDGGL